MSMTLGMTVAKLEAERRLIEANATVELKHRKAVTMPHWLEHIKQELCQMPIEPGFETYVVVEFPKLVALIPTDQGIDGRHFVITPADARDLIEAIQAGGTSGFTVTANTGDQSHGYACQCAGKLGCNGYLKISWKWPASSSQ